MEEEKRQLNNYEKARIVLKAMEINGISFFDRFHLEYAVKRGIDKIEQIENGMNGIENSEEEFNKDFFNDNTINEFVNRLQSGIEYNKQRENHLGLSINQLLRTQEGTKFINFIENDPIIKELMEYLIQSYENIYQRLALENVLRYAIPTWDFLAQKYDCTKSKLRITPFMNVTLKLDTDVFDILEKPDKLNEDDLSEYDILVPDFIDELDDETSKFWVCKIFCVN